jgi:hypothetical protein
MKNDALYPDEEFTWNDFTIKVRQGAQSVRFENPKMKDKGDSQLQIRSRNQPSALDPKQKLDCIELDDELMGMDEFRVRIHNERFGFRVENPSDTMMETAK